VLAGTLLALVRSAPMARMALRLLPHCPALLGHMVGVAAGTRPLIPG
jgi:ABC-type methionine transport system permease subunit